MFSGLLHVGAWILISALSAERIPVSSGDIQKHAEQARYWPSIAFLSKGPIPNGYYNLCVTGNPICQVTPARHVKADEAGAVALTDLRQSELVKVHMEVNRSIRPYSDGRDVWQVNPHRGDCKDYALTKKQRLIALGWPSSALVIAIARTAWGAEHAVLIARTDRGDLVLDSLKQTVVPWSPAMYRWQMVQSPTETWVWYEM